MKKLNRILKLIIIFIFLISCSSADKYLGINEDLIEEEEEDKDDGGDGGGSVSSNYYSSIAAAMADGVIAYWKMNETGGALVSDETGAFNGTSNATIDSGGKFGNCRYHSGVALTTTAIDGLLISGGTYTFSFWVKINNTTSTRYIFHARNASNQYIGIAIYNSASFRVYYTTTNDTFNYDPDNIANLWAHLVFVFDATGPNSTLYVNGISQDSPQSYVSTSPIGNASEAYEKIGSIYLGNNNYYIGYIDDFVIWNRALSASEVTAIYNSNAPLTP